jgi:hypothetical protein
MVLPYYLFRVEKHVCLSCDVYVIGAAWWTTMRIEVEVGDLVQRTGDGQAQVGYSVVRQSRGRVTLCTVFTVHKETMSAGFLVQPQNQGRRFLPVWPQNWWLRFLWFGLKITRLGFPVWASKPTAMVW